MHKISRCSVVIDVPGLQCSTPPDIANVNMSSEGTGYLDVITFSCSPGYRYLSGDLSRQCVSPGVWTGTLPACEGSILAQYTVCAIKCIAHQ